MEANETEIVRKLGPIGQLAMLREVLTEEDLLQTPSMDLSMADRDDLQRGQVLEFDCTLRQTPIERLQQVTNRFVEFNEAFGSYVGITEEDAEDVDEVRELLSALSREGNVLRAVLSDEAACDFVLTHDSNNFRNRPLEFPREQDTYTVLGQVITRFDDDEGVPLIDFVDMAARMEDNPRKRRREMMKIKRQFAEAASNITGRTVSVDEFEISHPDVEMKIFAIYR